jgi:replicative DNA helicase
MSTQFIVFFYPQETRKNPERNAVDFPRYLVGCWAKLKAYCARLALIVHYLRLVHQDVGEEEIDAESLTRAVRLVDYFKWHARKVHTLMDADPRIADARKVFRWIITNRLKRFTKRDVHANHRATFRTAHEIDPVLVILERHYLIVPIRESDRSGPGRSPSPAYLVNPLAHDVNLSAYDVPQITHNSQNPREEGNSV